MWTNHLHVNSLFSTRNCIQYKKWSPSLVPDVRPEATPHVTKWKRRIIARKNTLFQTEKEKEGWQKFTKVATEHLNSSGKTGRYSQKRSQDEHTSLEGRWETGKSSRKFNTSLNKGNTRAHKLNRHSSVAQVHTASNPQEASPPPHLPFLVPHPTHWYFPCFFLIDF